MDKIWGIRIDKYTKEALLEKAKKTVESKEKAQFVTLNTELLLASKTDPVLKKVINDSTCVIPESSGIYLADNFLGSKIKPKLIRLIYSGIETMRGKLTSLPERVSGVDFSSSLAALAAEESYKLLLVGGEIDVAKEAAANLRKLHPKLDVTGIYGGKVWVDDSSILEEIRKISPDILLVAFGPGKQEKWIGVNLPKIEAKVVMGVGGTLDFIAGRVLRAPKIVRNIGMEWLFRLVLQPWRLKRQLALFKFAGLLLKEKDF